jgi:poly-gamma-glutamate capsule biosynthesis protein CapA/YwtB (metallophosphatase superfamily)
LRTLCSPVLFALSLGGCGERGVPLSAGAPVSASSPAAPVSAPVVTSAASASVAPALAEGAAAPAVAEAEPEPEPTIVLAAGGDVNFGRECGQAILKDLGYAPFAGLNEAWSSADARFVNLESQLSDQHGLTQSPSHRLIFTGPPGGAEVLANAKVSLVSTANNHAWDFGKSALFETIANLERAQVAFAGTGRDVAQAYKPVVLRVKGRSIALFAVTQVWNQPPFEAHEGKDFVAWADVDKLKAGIEQARRENDFVLVSYHGGAEYVDVPVERTRRFVKAVMALGVDAFIGHHPHVPQGIGWAEGRPVVYSLGNFVFAGHDERPWTKQSFFARITLRKGERAQVAACPFALDGHRPRSLDKQREALAIERFRLHLVGTSTSVGGSNVASADELGCLHVTEKPPIQTSLSASN